MKRYLMAAVLALASAGMANAEHTQPTPLRQREAAAPPAPAMPVHREAQTPPAPQFDFYDNQPRSYGRWLSQQYNNENGGS